MKRLAALPVLPRADTKAVRALFPPEARQFTGRMRVQLARDMMERHLSTTPCHATVADPLLGTGTTGVAAALHGVSLFLGAELVPVWADAAKAAIDRATLTGAPGYRWTLACHDAADFEARGCALDLIITSPPFPNAHSQGASPMQAGLRHSKSTYAGNDFECSRAWGVGGSPDPEKWRAQLVRALTPWAAALQPGGRLLVHVKNFVSRGAEVRVDLWAAKAIASLPELTVEGYHPVPLGYRSAFQEWRRFPRQAVVRRRRLGNGLGWVECLACGHEKRRKLAAGRVLPKNAICTECGPLAASIEVREERVVVGLKKREARHGGQR